MRYLHNKTLVPIAKSLRREMTKEEKKLWYDFLRTYPVNFQRQKIFGTYIVDFYCAKANLILELDGSQHYEEIAMEKDQMRDEFFAAEGIMVLRIPNTDIHRHFGEVCQMIDRIVRERSKQ